MHGIAVLLTTRVGPDPAARLGRLAASRRM